MVILCDFDDTAADRNVATLLLDHFEPSTRHGLHRRFVNREISLAAYQEAAFSRLASTRGEQAAFAREQAGLRPGFAELAAYCRDHGIELAIVSHGLDFYVRAILERAGIEHVPFFAVETGERDGRTTFEYRFASAECAWWPGNCKCSVLEWYRGNGHRVIYAGDGFTDTCPARRADFVFARGELLSYCRAHDIPHQELTDFHAVVGHLEALGTEARP